MVQGETMTENRGMNVFVIESPTQVLNAIEASQHFGFERKVLIVLLTGLFGKEYYDKLVDPSYWGNVQFIPFYYKTKKFDFGTNRPRNLYERIIEISLIIDQALRRRRLDKSAKSIGFAEKVVLGNYRSDLSTHMRHFANTIRFGKLYIIDDGTDTLLINDQRKREKNGLPTKVPQAGGLLKRIKKKIRDKYVDWNTTGVESLTYFTCYEIDVMENDSIEVNSYDYIRSLARNARSDDRVLFLGQPLVDDGYVTESGYFECLTKVENYFKNNNLIYVPHPRETDKYVASIRSRFNFQVKRFDVPIEYEIAVHGTKPKCVASFFCSALENCAAIFGKTIEIKSFHVGADMLLKNKDVVAKIYSYFESTKNGSIGIVY
ncbi:MAG: polysialyltransferase family glycosyltransferase [Desulfatitalea sp.]